MHEHIDICDDRKYSEGSSFPYVKNMERIIVGIKAGAL